MRGLSDIFAALMLLVALYGVGRLLISFASRRRTERDADLVHVVMGVSMAGMLAPSLAAGPTGLWLLAFCASTAWFGWRLVRDAERERAVGHVLGQHVPHLLMSGAMVYMLVLVAWSGSMGPSHRMSMVGMSMGGAGATEWPLLTVALAVLLLGDGALTFGRSLRQVPSPLPQASTATLPQASMAPERGAPSSVALEVRQTVTQGSSVLAPRSVMACQLVMSLVMGYMLVSLL